RGRPDQERGFWAGRVYRHVRRQPLLDPAERGVPGSLGRFNYYLSGDYIQNNIGITQATPDNPIHDATKQGHGFGYFEYLLDSTSKVGAILGTFVGHFQVPNSRNQTPSFTVNGIDSFDSAK